MVRQQGAAGVAVRTWEDREETLRDGSLTEEAVCEEDEVEGVWGG